eukprot:469731_1
MMKLQSALSAIVLVQILAGRTQNDTVCDEEVNAYAKDAHYSWTDDQSESSAESVISALVELQQQFEGSIEVPIYDVLDVDFDPTNKATQRAIYDLFYNKVGALIVRGAYSKDTMNEYNTWCEGFLDRAKNDANCRHPKQPGKYLINDVMSRLGKDDPDLLMRLINNKFFTLFTDILLGFMKYGSVTTHWIEAGGDRQLSHVDYPMHVGSGPFWENNVDKLKKLTTSYQLNKILPYFSLQVLIASDKMDVSNGATEMIPGTHLIDDVDILIHDKEVYAAVEPYFESVDLQQGDFLIFNRRLIHRGGKNISDKRRNSLIMQCIWLWGVGQEIIDYDEVYSCLEKSDTFKGLSDEEKEVFLTRLNPPYPADIKLKT